MYLSNKSELKSRVRRLHAYGPKGDERQSRAEDQQQPNFFATILLVPPPS